MRDIGSIHEVELVVRALLPQEMTSTLEGSPLSSWCSESSSRNVSSDLDDDLVDVLLGFPNRSLGFEVERGVGSVDGRRRS